MEFDIYKYEKEIEVYMYFRMVFRNTKMKLRFTFLMFLYVLSNGICKVTTQSILVRFITSPELQLEL